MVASSVDKITLKYWNGNYNSTSTLSLLYVSEKSEILKKINDLLILK